MCGEDSYLMKRQPTDFINAKVQQRELLLGVDGGGTKTRAVVTDAAFQVLGEGVAGPSNPLRVGISTSAAAVREAFSQACTAADVQTVDIAAAEIGLAGVRREDLRERMKEALKGLGIRHLEVVTDADIALFGATAGAPGLVIIAGTGSICCGRNGRGKYACAGGWGPLAGDEGSGSWIARRALQAVARGEDGRGQSTALSEAACAYFNISTPDNLSIALYAPSMTNDRIAGFAKQVIEAARKDDDVARELIAEAGRELGTAAAAVVRKLRMESEKFQVAYVGGVFAAAELVLETLRKEVLQIAPQAFLAPPLLAPPLAAARMASRHLRTLALAG